MKARISLIAIVIGVAGLLTGVFGGPLWRGPPVDIAPPQDRAGDGFPLASDRQSFHPLRLTVFGTSLSSPRYDWPEVLAQELTTCLAREVILTRVTRPGANILWAVEQQEAVVETAPDLILLEFAINDADLWDGVALNRSETTLQDLLEHLDSRVPHASVVVLTMNPAQGLRGVLRPRLAAHYDMVRRVAGERDLALVDLDARWRALPRAARGLDGDGLHPDPAVVRAVVVPAVTEVLTSAGAACPAAAVRPGADG